MSIDTAAVAATLRALQQRIVGEFEAIDGGKFRIDPWEKAPDEALTGNGITCILEGGSVFERAGVGFSHVRGTRLPPSASASRPELAGRGFEALGVSLVIHPQNPFVPTVHLNVRLLVAGKIDAEDIWWVGGGMDLTPYYGFEEDAIHFHQCCRDALDPFGTDLYARFKPWCDDYFYLKHRNEPRGIGGIFFDDFNTLDFGRSVELLESVGENFLKAYLPIVKRRVATPFGAHEREWQTIRRGRYVEFNLVFDRGTHFGLQSGGRSESILMSMPPEVRWRYDYQPAPHSREAELLEKYLTARSWL